MGQFGRTAVEAVEIYKKGPWGPLTQALIP
jgi:hypothetical protein